MGIRKKIKKISPARVNRGNWKNYRSPSVFSSQKTASEKKLQPGVLKAIFWAAVAIFIIYVLFLSRLFKVEDIIVEGNKLLKPEEIADQLPRGRNIFLFSVKTEREKLLTHFPEIKDVVIYRGLPNALKVIVLERDAKLIWQSDKSFYLISSQGEVAREIDNNMLSDFGGAPIVVDEKNLPIEKGKKIVSPIFVAFITQLFNEFGAYTKTKAGLFKISETTFDVTLETDEGFYVKFNSVRSPEKQLENLKKVLLEKKGDIQEYVDLRVDGWIYYR